jgi:hypothetical protein
VEGAKSYDERVEEFRSAYITQSQLRQQAEARLTRMVRNRMDQQDKTLFGGRFYTPRSEESNDSETEEGKLNNSNSKVVEFEEK